MAVYTLKIKKTGGWVCTSMSILLTVWFLLYCSLELWNLVNVSSSLWGKYTFIGIQLIVYNRYGFVQRLLIVWWTWVLQLRCHMDVFICCSMSKVAFLHFQRCITATPRAFGGAGLSCHNENLSLVRLPALNYSVRLDATLDIICFLSPVTCVFEGVLEKYEWVCHSNTAGWLT